MARKNNRKNKPGGSLDTNALLRLLLGDVPAQTRAVEALLRGSSVFEVADAAIIEMVFVLEKIYGMDRALIRENVFAITRNNRFACNKKLFERCVPLYVAHTSLSIIDCALISYAQLHGTTPLYTFDKDIVKHAHESAQVPATA